MLIKSYSEILGSRLLILFTDHSHLARGSRLKQSLLEASETSQVFAIIRRINFVDITGKNALFRAIGIASPKERAARIHNAPRSFRGPRPSPFLHPFTLACNLHIRSSHSRRTARACVREWRACVRAYRTGDRSNGAEADSYYTRDLK